MGGHIATIVVALIVGYLSQFLQPKSKLLLWSPHNFLFNLQNENVTLVSHSLTIQNAGRKAADDVEIVFGGRPDFYQFWPALDFMEATTPNGEHVIRVKSLGPRQWVFLQMLSYKTLPQLPNVRWRDGAGKWIAIQPQRVYPPWLVAILRLLLIIGAGTITYFLIRGGAYVVSHAGLVK